MVKDWIVRQPAVPPVYNITYQQFYLVSFYLTYKSYLLNMTHDFNMHTCSHILNKSRLHWYDFVTVKLYKERTSTRVTRDTRVVIARACLSPRFDNRSDLRSSYRDTSSRHSKSPRSSCYAARFVLSRFHSECNRFVRISLVSLREKFEENYFLDYFVPRVND